MPRVIKQDLTPKKRYNWDLWLDGKSRVFQEGKDYANWRSLCQSARLAATTRGLEVVAQKRGATVVIQAKHPTKKGTPKG